MRSLIIVEVEHEDDQQLSDTIWQLGLDGHALQYVTSAIVRKDVPECFVLGQ